MHWYPPELGQMPLPRVVEDRDDGVTRTEEARGADGTDAIDCRGAAYEKPLNLGGNGGEHAKWSKVSNYAA